jgi:hypothetical protein
VVKDKKHEKDNLPRLRSSFTCLYRSSSAKLSERLSAVARAEPEWFGERILSTQSWPEKLTRRWKVIVGEGYATPIVVGKTVYSFTRRDGNEVLMIVAAVEQVVEPQRNQVDSHSEDLNA